VWAVRKFNLARGKNVMSTIESLRRQLPWAQFARHLSAEAPRRIFNGFSVSSYAQTGEDLLIAALLSWPKQGYYVDVGCHHPIKLSNTYLLYLRGLSGLAIDANGEYGPVFSRHRPRDTFVPACVGEEGGFVEFKIFKDRALSSISGQTVAGLAEQQYQLERKEQVPLKSLNEIFDAHRVPVDFTVLSIDVEAHDFSALRSLDLTKYHPRLIVIELHGADPGALGDHPVAQHCAGYGYKAVAYQKSNAFFLRDQ
jgi:Methyltransferase FkbM domain